MTHASRLPIPTSPRLRLRVTRAAETHLRGGHPWLYESSIREQNRAGTSGELAVVYGRDDRFLAVGLYDPDSPLRVRVLHAGKPRAIDAAWWAEHLDAALTRREGVADEGTDGLRLVNGESDGWGGLVLDRYADTLVMKLYTTAWFGYVPFLLDLLEGRLPGHRVVLRLSRNIAAHAREERGWADPTVLHGDTPDGAVVFHESGLRFEADVMHGQKTGFFLDQRENRRHVERLASGRRVLNAFSFTGGFSLYAARGGAREVTSLDISAHALRGAERNFALNADDAAVASCRHHTVQADVFDWLQTSGHGPYDLIVLDPPSLARREHERDGAVRAYGRLAAGALRHLAPGGTLVSASCSAHVSDTEFFGAVRDAAEATGRPWRELRTTHHAPDHHASFPEAQYLKAVYLEFGGE